jgi:hypothetical protein
VQLSDDPAEPVIDAATRDDALRVLNRLLTLCMLPELWAEREGLARMLVQALESGEVQKARFDTAELEVLDDRRVGRVAKPGSVPPTEPIREIVGQLVHLPPQDDIKPGCGGTDRHAKPDR